MIRIHVHLIFTEAPKERPRLQLSKRSENAEAKTEGTAPSGSSSIFGGAKPVDTAKKEQEVEQV